MATKVKSSSATKKATKAKTRINKKSISNPESKAQKETKGVYTHSSIEETMLDFLSGLAGKSKKDSHLQKATECVIYTRVSTKEQAENNTSLESQKKACEAYAKKHGLTIASYFGGTYESAKTDERKEFQQMLSYVTSSTE